MHVIAPREFHFSRDGSSTPPAPQRCVNTECTSSQFTLCFRDVSQTRALRFEFSPPLPPATAYECKPTSWPRIFFWAFAHARFRHHTYKTVACARIEGEAGGLLSEKRRKREIDAAGEICVSLSTVFLNESLSEMYFIYNIQKVNDIFVLHLLL